MGNGHPPQRPQVDTRFDVDDPRLGVPPQDPVEPGEVEDHRLRAEGGITVRTAGAPQRHRNALRSRELDRLGNPRCVSRPKDVAGRADGHAPAFDPLQPTRQTHAQIPSLEKMIDGIERMMVITTRQRAGT